MQQGTSSWLRTAATVLFVPLLIAVFSQYFIPSIIRNSSKAEERRTAKLKKAVEVQNYNEDFTIKLHRLKTMMLTFQEQNVRQNLSGAKLSQAQNAFQKEYTDRYLALDETAWWWYWNLKRDAEIFELLSPEDITKLTDLIGKYGENVGQCVGAINPLWRYLSSSRYGVGGKSQDDIKKLVEDMNRNVNRLFGERVVLAKDISALFAQSRFEPEE